MDSWISVPTAVFEKIEPVEKLIKLLFLRPILSHSSILLRTAVDMNFISTGVMNHVRTNHSIAGYLRTSFAFNARPIVIRSRITMAPRQAQASRIR